MVFSSLLFIYAFLPISIGIYYITPSKFRNNSLLMISVVFCGMCSFRFLAFMIGYVIFNYFAARLTEALNRHRILSRIILSFGVIANLSVFFIFKSEYFSDLWKIPEITMIGLSFFTLSAVGYLFDVFRRRINAEQNIISFALYIMFFAKLPMGPIVSYTSFSGMLKKRGGGFAEIGAGLSIFVKGLSKKLLFADNLYLLYSAVRSMEVHELSALSAWLGTFAYILCLYFSISGIADMGTGIARCFGFRLPQSFNYPVFSMGMNDFCSRWHMPVVRWFRRYLVNPFMKNATGKPFESILFITSWGMLGLWYDVTPNKLIWGIIIGTAAMIERIVSNNKMMKATALIYTFLIMSVSWIFFFGDSISYSFYYFLALIGGNNNIVDSVSLYLLKSYVAVLLVGAYAATDLFKNLVIRSRKIKFRKALNAVSPVYIFILLVMCTALISYSGVSEMTLLKM